MEICTQLWVVLLLIISSILLEKLWVFATRKSSISSLEYLIWWMCSFYQMGCWRTWQCMACCLQLLVVHWSQQIGWFLQFVGQKRRMVRARAWDRQTWFEQSVREVSQKYSKGLKRPLQYQKITSCSWLDIRLFSLFACNQYSYVSYANNDLMRHTWQMFAHVSKVWPANSFPNQVSDGFSLGWKWW